MAINIVTSHQADERLNVQDCIISLVLLPFLAFCGAIMLLHFIF